jgi:hypothetical protein
MLDQMDNTLRDDSCLATSRAGNDEQRPIAVFNRPELFRVEPQHECKPGFRIQDSGKTPRSGLRIQDSGFRENHFTTPVHPDCDPPFPRNQATAMIALP